jgi:hypothetical protein
MSCYSVHLEDVLPDGVDSVAMNGKIVMKEFAPAVTTVSLHKHVTFKNPDVEKIFIDAACATS